MNLQTSQVLLEMLSNCAFSAYFVLINHISARNGVHVQNRSLFCTLHLTVGLSKTEEPIRYPSGYNKTFLVQPLKWLASQ